MSKIVNTLNIGDKAYRPTIEEIVEYPINKIEKSESGIKVGVSGSYRSFYYSKNNAAISSIIQFEASGPWPLLYLRKEDAEKEQVKLRVRKLKSLQVEANTALFKLNEFTLKYFTTDQP